MMLATAFLPMLGSAAGLGGAAAGMAGLVPGLGGALAAGSSGLTVLSGMATAASMASTLVGGLSSMAQANSNAQMAKLQGQQDYLASEQSALQIRRELLQKTGAARVAFAASGLDVSSAAAVESDLTSQANYATSIEKSNAQIRQAQAAARARQYKMQGTVGLAETAMKIAGQDINFGLDIAKRG